MNCKRIIPCLDIKDGRVVKGVNFIDIKDAGDPVQCAVAYEAAGADELVFLDITATNENRETNLELFKKVKNQIKIPFAIGGGIKSLDDIERMLLAGADKVGINSAAVQNPDLIKQAADKFGSKKIVIAIDVKKTEGGCYHVMINGGKTDAEIEAVSWAKQCEELGAGEILLTSMDSDGAKTGFDREITKAVISAVSISVIASGGAGMLEHFHEAFADGADAALAASLFHFGELTVKQVKEYLKGKGINVNI